MRERLRELVRRAPGGARLVRGRAWVARRRFVGSDTFWDIRYRDGATSGEGSYGRLAHFKADYLNRVVEERGVASVIEFGCGDGHQLSLAHYPRYIGLDVSPRAIQQCLSRFAAEPEKSFYLYHSLAFRDHHRLFRAELALSLDVIYHLIEDEIYRAYMGHLFDAATRYVVIYSSNHDQVASGAAHVRHRPFSDWVDRHAPAFQLVERTPNRYPYDPTDPQSSFADFYLYERTESTEHP